MTVFLACAAQAQPAALSSANGKDEAAIRAILQDSAAGHENPHVSPQLDWENAFGIRYTDLKKRDAFYGEVVKPLQAHDTDTTLEVKVRFITPDVAVADEYWHIVGQLDVETHKPGPDRWGRKSYVITRGGGGDWTEVLERVADLRYGYYHHYTVLPKAVPVAPATLAGYAGRYVSTNDRPDRVVTVQGDHLVVASPKKVRMAIPVSTTDFLLFNPNDLAEYDRLHFGSGVGSALTITIADEVGDVIGTLLKAT